MEATYSIVRFYADTRPSKTLEEGLTLEDAQDHCTDPETSSRTAENSDELGDWFDGYREE